MVMIDVHFLSDQKDSTENIVQLNLVYWNVGIIAEGNFYIKRLFALRSKP